MSKGNIYVKNTAEETAVSNDILKVSTFCQKPLKVLDMTPSQKTFLSKLQNGLLDTDMDKLFYMKMAYHFHF